MDESRPTEKACTKCGAVKPLEEFHRNPALKDGRNSSCRTCKNAQLRAYVARDPERAAEARARYVEANRERLLAKRRIYAAANREKLAEQARERYAKNPEKFRASRKEYVARNRESVAATQLRWQQLNADKASAAKRRWRKRHPEKNAEIQARRRARIANSATGPVDAQALWTGRCGICDLVMSMTAHRFPHRLSPSLDHIIPLARGGSHTQDNLQWAHLGCNQAKRDSLLD